MGSVDGPRQADHSDTTFKANELVLMHFADPVAQKFDRAKKNMIQSQGDLRGTQENLQKDMGDVGKKAYDHFRNKNVSHENAMKLAAQSEAQYNNNGVYNEGSDRREHGEKRYVHTR